ncbi:MAG: glycosyltransferase family 39 protein [Chloroflexota bacterium]
MVSRLRGSIRPQVLIYLLLLILLAFFLRLHHLDAFSFWTDEGLTPARSGYSISQILRNEIVIQGFVSKDTHPPLYYLIIHFTSRLFGETDFAYRFPSVLFGILLVPLLYQFGRRLAGSELGLIVALLAAVNPLQVYYAQEARMYTLLVLLGAASSYVLWRALSDPNLTRKSLTRYAVLYVILAGLTVYTHYTAVFLVAIQALFWAWLLWRQGLKWLIIGGVVIGVLAAIPLIPYTIPRLFTGAEANYTYVSPVTLLQDVVHFFNQGLTTDFNRWTVRASDILALILLLLGTWAARPWLKRSFLVAYLLAVVLGLMAGSLVKPMYQGVRHIMIGSPAFMLLVGYGVWWLWNWSPRKKDIGDLADTDEQRWPNPVGVLALSLVLLSSSVALLNLYRDPAYAKVDFRAMINFIEQRATEIMTPSSTTTLFYCRSNIMLCGRILMSSPCRFIRR